MLHKKTKFFLALLLGISFTAVITFTGCNNSDPKKEPAKDTVVVKMDTASVRPVKTPTNPAQ